ncbi:MAG: phospho-sugar mutase [Clostridiales bacterium]|nr:phospho-sugar mutase [Clostridiales bacterium]MDD7036245.1 phospho-sugar mutase [Bacillota bacterium]MDY2920897.1 phospho-sugar mutase [Lentihominibacter sp.]
MSYREEYENWINSPFVNEEEKDELRAMSEEEKKDAFYRICSFGTAGMRAVMGPGTNRINVHTVRMAAKAMAGVLLEEKGYRKPEKARKKGFFARLFGASSAEEEKLPKITIVIAYDTRNNSELLARETAGVLAASGIDARLFPKCAPVPLLSFAVRHMGADGGVVITASHNTKEYNGFKAYDETGCQMRPEVAERIAAGMEAMDNPLDIDSSGSYEYVEETVTEAFMEAIAPLGIPEDFNMEDAAGKLRAVYTPLHGSGRDYVMKALDRGGFSGISLCREQAEADGDFPTVTKPNPEDAAALELACEQAKREGADLVLGTDPDCDRIGVAVIEKGEAVCLSGNQVGALLIDYLSHCAGEGGRKNVITTIVTGEAGPITGLLHGFDVIKTLTGFKYIGDIMNDMEADGREDEFLLGYEESYGYLPGTHARDKDGVSTALVICRMAAWYKAQGLSLTQVLEQLYEKTGYWLDAQESFVFPGSEGDEKMRSIMARIRVEGAAYDGFVDYKKGAEGLPPANVIKFTMDDSSWIAVRPSGTEPKIKVYYCMRGSSRQEAEDRRREVSEDIHRIMG